MKVLFLFTYGTSLKNWKDSGYLQRELTFFESINKKYGTNFIFLTFGDYKDENIVNNNFINIIPVYKFLNKKKNKLHNTINLILNLKPLFRKLNIEFDLIKTNQLFGAWIAIFIKRFSKKPLIIRTGYDLFLFSRKDRKNILKIFLYYLLTFICLNISTLYTVTSENDYRFIKKRYIFKKDKLKIRRNWILEGVSKNINQSTIIKKRNLVTVGRLEDQKDYRYLINTFSNSEYFLDVIGSGTLDRELRSLSSSNVNFMGNVNFEDLNSLYEDYLFYVSATNYEGNPKSILEAMSKGCIVIAPDIPNVTEIIENNVNGIIYNKLSDNLIEIIENLKNDITKLNNISTKAVEHVKLNNSLNLAIENEHKDYQYVLSK